MVRSRTNRLKPHPLTREATSMATEYDDSPITEARLKVSIGNIPPEWKAHAGDLEAPSAALRSSTLGVAKAVDRVKAMPPEFRGAALQGIVKTAKETLAKFAAQRPVILGALDERETRYRKDVREHLERLGQGDVNTAFAASQVRDRVAASETPSAAARGILSDPDALRAILSAPPIASGLTDAQHQNLREAAIHRWLPDVRDGLQTVAKARAEMERSFDLAEQLVAKQAGLVRRAGGWAAPWEIDGDAA